MTALQIGYFMDKKDSACVLIPFWPPYIRIFQSLIHRILQTEDISLNSQMVCSDENFSIASAEMWHCSAFKIFRQLDGWFETREYDSKSRKSTKIKIGYCS
jgi:hypothetical protein